VFSLLNSGVFRMNKCRAENLVAGDRGKKSRIRYLWR
jgi:hypothetical protein